MKKLLLSMLILASSLVYNQANAQVHSQGGVVIDVFYGFPNLYSAIVRTALKDPIYTNTKVTTVGPFGVTAEYLLSDKVGFGAEFTYTSTVAKYDYNGYSYKDEFNRIRILPRINIHFGDSDKADPYLTLGMGYGHTNFTETSNGGTSNLDVKSPINVSMRMAFGVRYFFTDHIGLMTEFGIGGPLMRGGVAFKF